MHREWSGLAHLGGLTKYSIPYESAMAATILPNTNGGASPGFNLAATPMPHLLRLLFPQHILTFPGIDPLHVDRAWGVNKETATFSPHSTQKCTNLPSWEQLCIKMAAIWVAGVLHGLFVTGPNVKKLDSWFLIGLKLCIFILLLRITDPSKMIAALLSLILATPFGTQSLFGRLISSMLAPKASHIAGKPRLHGAKSSKKRGSNKGDNGAVVSTLLVKGIKDTLSVVFCGPLTEWCKVCRLNDRVYDPQVFLDDLVNTARSEDNSTAAFITLAKWHQQNLYFLFHEARVKGGNLMDWCRRGLKYTRSSSLDLLTADSPRAQVDMESLVSHPLVNREALIRERVDVDEIIQFASRAPGEETRDGTAGDSVVKDDSGASIVSSPTTTPDTLRDHYPWGSFRSLDLSPITWFSGPEFTRMLDEALSTGSLPRQSESASPRPTELRKQVQPVGEIVRFEVRLRIGIHVPDNIPIVKSTFDILPPFPIFTEFPRHFSGEVVPFTSAPLLSAAPMTDTYKYRTTWCITKLQRISECLYNPPFRTPFQLTATVDGSQDPLQFYYSATRLSLFPYPHQLFVNLPQTGTSQAVIQAHVNVNCTIDFRFLRPTRKQDASPIHA
ncbi:hypothetical protein BS47DRAFT_1488207 [Hydnum rufescens UP504]|uniref:PX domain-containing protein n=1 Tax=Hydnum rufescens UP504 TaxID=1448309 RepID=A0A9P6DST0_9AGAM|nr:hypothetical protein BS47DRAFT_1488207 [Hydnum rufescens UP504]